MCEELLKFKEKNHIKLWCILGDFNVMRKQDEKIGCQPLDSYKNKMKDFSELIENINGEAKSRLDRTLMWNGWMFGHNVNNRL